MLGSGCLGIPVNKEVRKSLDLKHGSIVETTIRNTGKMADIKRRKYKDADKVLVSGPLHPGVVED